MRIRSILPILVLVLLAACGQSSLGGVGSLPAQTGANGDLPAPASSEAAPAGAGSVDCAKVKAAAVELLSVQFLAQLRDPDVAEQVKTKQIGNLDLDPFLSAMHDLHALDGQASALGDPKAAIDTYEAAGKAAQTLFATEPITQAAADTYMAGIGTVSDFLGHQVAIAGAMDAAGC